MHLPSGQVMGNTVPAPITKLIKVPHHKACNSAQHEVNVSNV